MADISSLGPGQSKTLRGVYRVTEADMGKTNVINKVTAKAGSLIAEGSSNAAAMEAVRYALSATKDETSVPQMYSDTYVEGETVTWSIDMRNTGNQTLSGLTITEKLSGATISGGATVPAIPAKGTAKKDVSYLIPSGSEDFLENAVDISNANVSLKDIKSGGINISKYNPRLFVRDLQFSNVSYRGYSDSVSYSFSFSMNLHVKAYDNLTLRDAFTGQGMFYLFMNPVIYKYNGSVYNDGSGSININSPSGMSFNTTWRTLLGTLAPGDNIITGTASGNGSVSGYNISYEDALGMDLNVAVPIKSNLTGSVADLYGGMDVIGYSTLKPLYRLTYGEAAWLDYYVNPNGSLTNIMASERKGTYTGK